jgi:hypothetical protein
MFAKLFGRPAEGEVLSRLVETRQVLEGEEEQNGAGKGSNRYFPHVAFFMNPHA